MAERRPLVIVGIDAVELPLGDTLPGGGGSSPTGAEIDGGNATMTYAGVPVFDFGSAT